jgi:hypothetical protein
MTSQRRRCVEVKVNHPPSIDSHSNAAERARREVRLDETIEQSFPASDPPSSNPNPDTHDLTLPHDVEVIRERFSPDYCLASSSRGADGISLGRSDDIA